MPEGKGRYTVGAKGTHGCKGYPVVGGEGKVHGCHATEAEAQAQQAAIYILVKHQRRRMPVLWILQIVAMTCVRFAQ